MESQSKVVLLTENYKRQVERQYLYTLEHFGEVTANELLQKIVDVERTLSTDYGIYKVCNELYTEDKRFRRVVIKGFAMIYEIREDNIRLFAFKSQRMNPRRIYSIRKTFPKKK